ncbi:hypothetical protein [Roseovarius amoyensis]|nr:hypothetical protein [Roseovarius amoyensis]
MTIFAFTLTISALCLWVHHAGRQASHRRIWSRRLQSMLTDS